MGVALSLLAFAVFGVGALVVWGDVPARGELRSVSGAITRIEPVPGRYGSHTRLWLEDVELYHRSASLAHQLEVGMPIEARVFRYHADRPALHVYALRTGRRELVRYEYEKRWSRRVATGAAALALAMLVAGLWCAAHARRFTSRESTGAEVPSAASPPGGVGTGR